MGLLLPTSAAAEVVDTFKLEPPEPTDTSSTVTQLVTSQ